MRIEADVARNMRIKNTEEVRLMRRAGSIVDLGVEAIMNYLKAGIRENKIAVRQPMP